MKKLIAFLCLILFSNSAFAVPNYTYTRVEDENYSASSPVGYFVNYQPQQNYASNSVYANDNNYHNIAYVVEEPVPASIQDIHTPQSYNRRRVVTESMRDERETADKVIDRAGKTVGILGVLGLITLGIVGVAHSF